jgi:hypothetical protein
MHRSRQTKSLCRVGRIAVPRWWSLAPVSLLDLYRGAASYVDRILKGAMRKRQVLARSFF